MLYDSIYIKFKNRQNQTKAMIKTLVSVGVRGGNYMTEKGA